MKKKIVVWATDENEKKLLVGLELKAKENKIAIHSFPEEIATEAFYNDMMDKWRADKEVAFPEGHSTVEKPLSITETLLPDNIKVTRGDLINRASTEWHFIVLSTKLYELYRSELEEKREKVVAMTSYDGSMWNEMKEFWNKVQQQVYDNNLLRNHAGQLKEGTNKVFEKLKELRTVLDKEFDEISKKNKGIFSAKLAEVEAKIEKGLGLKPIFDELKKIQNDYKGTKFNKKDRTEIWNRLDGAFKSVKEKKFGKAGASQGNNAVSRVERRYQGLMSAIGKMEHSINRDRKDIEYENRKINTTSGQLEQQIRQAKLKMIEERISSKDLKLQEMLSTKKELESKLEKEKKRAEVVKAKEAAKTKIAAQIKEKSADISEEEKLKIEKAAKEFKKKEKAPKATGDSANTGKIIAAVTPITAVTAAVKATGEKVEHKAEEVKEKVEHKVEDAKEKAGEVKENVAHKAEDVKEKVDHKAEEAKEKAADLKEKAEHKAGEVKENVAHKVEDAKKKAADVKENVAHKAGEVKENVAHKVEDAKEKAEDLKENVAHKAGEVKENVAHKAEEMKEKAADVKENVEHKAADLKEKGEHKLEDVKESVGDAIQDTKEAVSDAVENVKEKAAELSADIKEKGIMAGLAGAVGGMVAAASDTIKDTVESVKEKAEDAASSFKEGGKETGEIVESATATRKEAVNDLLNAKSEDVKEDKKSGVGAGLFGAAAGVVGGLIAKAADIAEDAADKVEDMVGNAIGEEE